MRRVFIGVDPGKSGAIAFTCGGKVTLVSMLPLIGTGKSAEMDAIELRRLLQKNRGDDAFAAVEKVQAVQKAGKSETFRFGDLFGQIKAVIRTCHIPMILVTPQTWKKKVLVGLDWKGNKEASVRYCEDLWPNVDLKRTPRCKGPHDGICDALCIAEYGRMTHAVD